MSVNHYLKITMNSTLSTPRSSTLSLHLSIFSLWYYTPPLATLSEPRRIPCKKYLWGNSPKKWYLLKWGWNFEDIPYNFWNNLGKLWDNLKTIWEKVQGKWVQDGGEDGLWRWGGGWNIKTTMRKLFTNPKLFVTDWFSGHHIRKSN